MVRRRLTLKRIDPWSVLKFGFVANLTLLAIGLLGGLVVWFFIRRLGLIDQVCGMALEVGFSTCSVDGGNLFRAVLLLGILGVVVQTGLVVFFAFLANLIADLTGGLRFTFADDRPDGAGRTTVTSSKGAASFTDDTSSTGSGGTSRDTGPRGAAAPTEERSSTKATTASTSSSGSDGDDPIFGDRGSSS